jgi:hypothetical protein
MRVLNFDCCAEELAARATKTHKIPSAGIRFLFPVLTREEFTQAFTARNIVL